MGIMTTQMQLKLAKYALAAMIIVMGAYGYHHFFSSEFTPVASWMIVALFVVIEIVILLMTTVRFEDGAGYGHKFSFGLIAAFILMWLISFVGIDQTIWSLVEDKYHHVQQEEVAIQAKTQTQQKLIQDKKELEKTLAQYHQQLDTVEKKIESAKRDLDKKYRHFNDTVYNNGLMCDTEDCLARKTNAQNAVDVSNELLKEYMVNKKVLLQKIKHTEEKIAQAINQIAQITKEQEHFSKQNSLALKNKQEESLLHIRIMDFFNIVFKNQITTPERAYVILLSLVVYPIYILFVVFVAMNSPQNREKRAKTQLQREQEAAKRKAQHTRVYDAVMLFVNLLKKVLIYLIKARKRKIAIKEVEVEKEVEVIKEIYKDGKEIVKVEVEVPYIIEKEVIVEKIVEKPIIEKEFVVIPADTDLNRLNEITGNQTKPVTLEELLEATQHSKKDFTLKAKAKDDKYSAA
jgi:hypothetical protein